MYRVLIVEDDKKITEILKNHLSKYGYEAEAVIRFDEIIKKFEEYAPHLVLLDINLPFYDGFYWCRRIRTISNVPILFISARTDDLNQVMAIEHGGDDYIAKPFHLDVVLAKIKSSIRRAYGEYAFRQEEKEQLDVNGLIIDLNKMQVLWKDELLSLSHKEFLLLMKFVKEKHRAISRDELLEEIWDEQTFVDDNTLTVNVNRLRKKLDELGLSQSIETVRGYGYRFSVHWGGE
ncbi:MULTISPECIES: response regulator transcription factor [Bacillus]|uniref:Transcriptional regulator n=2 Tax=Bacillus TaxID=1386 RepID=A0A0M4FW31_9BACI|nr:MULTISPECIES: response regulator transcription factor [Bacillus]ALC82905.1 transcriptional regulator [Bacillus gobiensis]MBP1081884.1 DNA-binding response OmpR family regulator [Bacillus capparidis]MED1096531.1 response regulator transcription factor [Bacillus capparidis]